MRGAKNFGRGTKKFELSPSPCSRWGPPQPYPFSSLLFPPHARDAPHSIFYSLSLSQPEQQGAACTSTFPAAVATSPRCSRRPAARRSRSEPTRGRPPCLYRSASLLLSSYGEADAREAALPLPRRASAALSYGEADGREASLHLPRCVPAAVSCGEADAREAALSLPRRVSAAVVVWRGGSHTARHEGDPCVSLLSCFVIDNAFDFFR